jgi:hypothetical protein
VRAHADMLSPVCNESIYRHAFLRQSTMVPSSGKRHYMENPPGRANGTQPNIRWVGNPTQWTAEHQARRNEHPQGRGAWRIENPYTQWAWIANPDQRHDTNIRGVGIQTN